MRELKFKVWDLMLKEMFSIDNKAGLFLQNNKIYCYNSDTRQISNLNIGSAIPLENYKLMQYTGLKDKHGTEIYEGDIVRFDDGGIAEVVFFCGAFMPKLEKGEGITINYNAKPIWQDSEVIGNIAENSELLGGKNE